MIDLFDRMERANGNGQAIELSHADLELLYDMLGDALAHAKDEVDEWTERFASYQRAKARMES